MNNYLHFSSLKRFLSPEQDLVGARKIEKKNLFLWQKAIEFEHDRSQTVVGLLLFL